MNHQIESRTYSDATTATGTAPIPPMSPAQQAAQACPQCGSVEWDRIEEDRRTGQMSPFYRCGNCDHEWGCQVVSLEEIRANLKEAVARGRDPFLTAAQCRALVALIDGRGLLARYVSLDEQTGKADSSLYREARAALNFT